jgi:hypothetical protein
MAETSRPRRPSDPVPNDLEQVETDIDYWTAQLAGCSGGSERASQIDVRLRMLTRAKERLLSQPGNTRLAIEKVRTLLGQKRALEGQDKVLSQADPTSGNMSLVRPVKDAFERIHNQFPGLVPAFDSNSISVHGLRLQIASAVACISTRIEQSDSSQTIRGQTIRIFISHSHADAAIAEAFADLFQAAFNLPCEAIRCSSVARYALQFGVEIPGQVRDEVLAASVLIGIVTQSSRESAWVLFELGARWGASKSLIPVLAPNGDASLLPPPIRDAHAMRCTNEDVIKLVEEISSMLGESIPRVSTYTKHIDAVLKAAQSMDGLRNETSAKPPPRIKWGCYQFDGEDRLFCTACYDTKGLKIQTTRLNSNFRQCPNCKAKLGSG